LTHLPSFKSVLKANLPIRVQNDAYLLFGAIRSLGLPGGIMGMLRRYDLRSTIVISGAPRSGTTWAAEVLNTIPGSTLLYEPLYLRSNPLLKEIGFRWQTHFNPTDRRPAARAYLKKALEGKVLNRWTLSRARLDSVLSTTTWIVKFVRANMLLGWMVRQFPIAPPLVIIRHPCAVVASQLRMGAWGHVSAPAECPEFFDMYPQFIPIRDGVKHLDEILAVQWCMEYFVILKEPAPHPWLLVAYEDLVSDSEGCFSSLFGHFKKNMPPAGYAFIHKDSSTTVRDGFSSHDGRLTSWKKYLEKEQIKRILKVTEAFGIDMYTDEIGPDANARSTLAQIRNLNGENIGTTAEKLIGTSAQD
jgi:hypothetical protein